MPLKFTVLLPVYVKNEPLEFKRSLKSIINQSLKPNELIILVDGPIKKEIESHIKLQKKKFSFIKVLSFKKNKGLGVVLNIGLKKSKFDYIARCDSDDISNINRFKKQILHLSKNQDIDVLGSNVIEKRFKNFNKVRKVSYSDSEIKKKILFKNPINHPSVIFKKKVILKCGGYEKMDFFEDYYLWFKVMNGGYKFCNLQENLVEMKVDENFYKRRLGFTYYRYYYFFLKKLFKKKYINFFVLVLNLMIRIPIIFITKNQLKFLYNIFLRA